MTYAASYRQYTVIAGSAGLISLTTLYDRGGQMS